MKIAQAAFGAFFALYMSLAIVPISVPAAIGVFVATLSSILFFAFRRRKKNLREAAGRVLNGAFNSIGQGRLRDASEVLGIVEEHLREAWSQRIVEIQRAIIAIRRGDMADAEKALDLAIAQPLQSFARDNAAYQLEGAHALRAFVRASLGKEGPAREDIDHVLRMPASEDALARVALAEALLLEQAGKREELRLLLSEKRTLLLEHTHPRERAIVRAFQRMVRADKASVYRKAEARREKAESEEPTLADWVAKVAPAAATFVRSARPAEQVAKVQPEHALAAPSPAAVAANAEARKQPEKGSFKWVFYGVGGLTAVIGLFTAIAMMWPSTEGVATPDQTNAAMEGILPLLLLPIGMLPVVYAVSRGLQWVARVRAEKDARAPKRARAGAPTDDELRALTQSPSPVVAAQAWLLLADHAERAADFPAALQAATTGLSRLRDGRDRVAADIVYPDLVSLRAFMLAAAGRDAESNAELASLGPAYPHYTRAVFRAGLIAILRRGDLRGALRWIEQGEADLPLSVREESLVDLVRAAVQPEAAGAGEIQRLKDELASMPEVKSWIRRASPHLLDAFERSTMVDVGLRIDTSAADPETDHAAEEEAAAEMESALGPRMARS
ncbi:MAG: hypothetical protein U0441_20460 [Polyangiaceae bacterium]